jgi:hypothetical protein
VTFWLVAALWNAVVLYVLIDVRRVMARNNQAIGRVLGSEPGPVTDRGVKINRIALLAALVIGNAVILGLGERP